MTIKDINIEMVMTIRNRSVDVTPKTTIENSVIGFVSSKEFETALFDTMQGILSRMQVVSLWSNLR